MMFKTQLICLIIVFFIGLYYFFSERKRSRTHRWYSALLIVSLFQLLFDVLSVYTVNHLETVPAWLNRLVHQLFMSLMLSIFFVVYKYLEIVIKEEVGAKLKSTLWVFLPLAVSFLGVLFLPIYYMETPQGNYSYGPGPINIYISIFVYVILIGRMLIVHGKSIPRKKRWAIIIALLSEAVIAILQAIFPTWLISCLGVTILNLSFYIMVENPDAALVEMLKKETQRADVANQAKTTFLAHMSHEIRTPINAILGMNEMILRESNEKHIIEYAGDVKGATNSLLGIINDILDITKIEAGKVTIIPVEYSFSGMMEEVISMMNFRAKSKKLRFIIDIDEDIPDKLRGDDIRNKQILMNLLSNAIKYTKEGSVTLQAKLMEGTNDKKAEIFFSVADTGIGIKPEDIERLYIPFERIEEKRNRKIEGTGLGMSIVMQLLNMLGGKMMITSEYGKGSEFSFTLKQDVIDPTPIGKIDFESKSMQAKHNYAVLFEAPKAKILAVDDNDINRKVFRSLLKKTKIQIDEAASGKECLELVKENHYDIIFMDHMMPEMDGVETFKILKEMKDYPCEHTPVVILTANAIAGSKAKYMTMGFQAFLPKPVDVNKLEVVIERLLKKDLIEYKKPKEAPGQEENMADELPAVYGIDWNYAKGHFNEREDLMEALRMFYMSIDSEAKELERLYASLYEPEGMKNYCTKVHSMKNSAMLLGIIPLGGMAKGLEDGSRNKEADVVEALHSVFLGKWCAYKDLLSEIFKVDEQKDAGAHSEEIEAVIVKIKAAAEDMDIDTLDVLLKELEKYSFAGEESEKIEKIKDAIVRFDIEYLMEI